MPLLAAPIAAAPYRASDLVHWRKFTVRDRRIDVGNRTETGCRCRRVRRGLLTPPQMIDLWVAVRNFILIVLNFRRTNGEGSAFRVGPDKRR